MKTKICNILELKQLVSEGKVVAFPTDTVYGLGVKYDDKKALEALKISKNRDPLKAIPVMVKNVEQMRKILVSNKTIEYLAEHFMPGALTIVGKKQSNLAKHIAEGKTTVAVRIPNSQIALDLLDEPMLVTSANLSGRPSVRTGEEVLEMLDGKIDGILMGSAKGSLASTIVEVNDQEEIKILREGVISTEEIKRVMEGLKDENCNG